MSSPDPDAALIADVFARDCPSRDVLAHVAGKWAVLALLALDEGGYRFNALRRRVQGVSEKMLAQTLQTLERDGLVAREVITAIPPRVEYALTPKGVALVPLVEDMRAYGMRWLLGDAAAGGAPGERQADQALLQTAG